MKKILLTLIAAMILFSYPGMAEKEISSLVQLNQPGMLVGISQGSAAEMIVQGELPQAGLVYFTDNSTAYMALAQGKIDAYVFDIDQMRVALANDVSGVHLLDETLEESVRVAVGISPVSSIENLEEKLNRFIGEIRADGTLDDMRQRWVMDGNDVMPDIPLPQQPSQHLTVGTTGIAPPYSYYGENGLQGFDVEMAYRFAAWLGADIRFKVYDYGAIIPAAVTGDVDCIMANLNVTSEREEALRFSDFLYEEKLGVMVRGEAKKENISSPAWKAYNGKRIGVLTGPLMESIAHENFPDSEYLLFSSYPDCITALLTGKIDAYLGDEPGLKSVHAEQPRIEYIHDRITTQEQSFAFRKNDPKSAALCEELNAFLAQCHADGTIQELDDIWFGMDEERKVVDMSGLTGERGTIRVVTTSTDMPFSYIKDGKNVGYDIDLVVRFCRYAGYQLELGDVDFAARIPAIQSGKYDFTTDMNVTEERREQVLFSDPTSVGGVVLGVLASDIPQAEQKAAAGSLADLEGRRVSVQTGTICGELVENAIPGAEVQYFNTQMDAMTALLTGKVDAWCTDEPVIRYMMLENDGMMILDERLDNSGMGAIFPKTEAGEALRDQYSAFVDQLWTNGTMEEIDSIWFGADAERRAVLDYESLPDTNGTLRMAVDPSYVPFAIMQNNRIIGYDVDIAARFCEAYGYRLNVVPMNFDGILAAVQTEKCDFAACCISITEERAESVLFSSPTYRGGCALAVIKPQASAVTKAVYNSLEELSGKRIGIQTGTTFDEIVLKTLPDVHLSYYNSYPDMVAALEADKIDGFPGDEPVLRMMAAEDSRLTVLSERMDEFAYGFVFSKTDKGDGLLSQINAWLVSIQENGKLEEIKQKWITGPDSEKTIPDYAAFPATNGTLIMATESAYAPMSYYRNGQIAGMEIDMAAQFCEANGYGLIVNEMNFDGILPAVQSGKADFAAAGISITEERKENVNFSVPYYIGGTVMTVLKAEPPAKETVADGSDASFWEGIVTSFRKTFLRENRWQLFLEGIGTTMLITLLSALFGTLLGFVVFMLCRNGNLIATGVTRFSMWLVQGTPMVVLLMILYYIIFGSVAISSIAVAVIGFTLTFGAAVIGLLQMGVGTIDRGQYEAAYALGHSNRHTFFRIILPQAIPHVLPAYKGEIVGLIKSTAIVGYIAVQDLTKMGDIVRSRTYEAFFPLIAVTIIYFVLEGLFGWVVSRIRVGMDAKKRKPERILKGVNTYD